MATYSKLFSTKATPQSEPTTIATHKNRAGGHGFKIDKWSQLERFLILGSESPTYYASAREMTVENAQNVLACIKEDGIRAFNALCVIHKENRAPKKGAILFSLALMSKHGDDKTRKAANDVVAEVCGTPTMLFEWMEYVKQFGGWGRGTRRAIANWYTNRDPKKLAYQALKYRQRNNWTHRDALRVAHPVATSDEHQAIFKYLTKGEGMDNWGAEEWSRIIGGYELAKNIDNAKAMADHIAKYQLPRECVPTEMLKHKEVWSALLEDMPMMAMTRNLGVMGNAGLLVPLSDASIEVTERLSNESLIKKSRMHPYHFLVAHKTYAQGRGIRGSKTWKPDGAIIDALNDAYYTSFGNIEPTGKRFYLGIDVSSSMRGAWGVAESMVLMPCEVAAAMAMATVRSEKHVYCAGFCNVMKSLNITRAQRLNDVLRRVQDDAFGSTDCAVPMLDALRKNIEADVFVVYTDNETWVGRSMHPYQALEEYRRKTGIPAKLIVVAVTATDFTIANPEDPGMLDVVGFDAATPRVISDFVKG